MSGAAVNAPAPGEAVTTVPQMMALPAGSVIVFTSPKGRGAAIKLDDGTWEATGVPGSVYDGLLLLEITGVRVLSVSAGPPAAGVRSRSCGPVTIQTWEGPSPAIIPEGVMRFQMPAETGLPAELEPPRAWR